MAKASGGVKIDGLSADIQAERLEALRQVVPEAFSEGQLDVDKLKILFSEDDQAGDEDGERFRLEWAGKHKVFDEIAKRTSCTLTLDSDRSSEDYESSKNLFIEGENLEVLRTLQKAYFRKVKMIYIDPPYNTGKDFVYNDNFRQTEADYCEDTCNIDENGNLKRAYKQNTKDSGRYHSNWLSMMYPRLYLARNLLRDDGVIFLSIDDNEVHNLRAIMNEIFGEENFLGQMVWHARGRSKTALSIDHEYIVVFAKSISNIVPIFDAKDRQVTWWGQSIERKYSNPDKDIRGEWRDAQHTVTEKKAHYTYSINANSGEVIENEVRNDSEWYGHQTWMYPVNTIKKLYEDKRLLFKPNKDHLALKVKKFRSEEDPFSALEGLIQRDEISSRHGTEELQGIFDGKEYFEYPKPSSLIKRLLASATTGSDIIIDFFSGSGTTAHAVMEQNAFDGKNRRCISVQVPEATPEDSEARRAGYIKISDIAIDRIKKTAEKIRKERPEYQGDLGVCVYRVTDSNFPQWHARSFESDSDLEESLFAHVGREAGGDEYARATEVLLKIGYDLNTSIEQQDGFLLADNSVALILRDDFKVKDLQTVFEVNPKMVIVLDRIFADDDSKINFALRCKEEKVIFQTV